MDVGRRAKQFAPFAALRGLDETIRQQEIIYEPKRDLSEEKKNELDMKLRILTYGMKIQATYFQKSWKDPSVWSAPYIIWNHRNFLIHQSTYGLMIPRFRSRTSVI